MKSEKEVKHPEVVEYLHKKGIVHVKEKVRYELNLLGWVYCVLIGLLLAFIVYFFIV
jgi:hypothetical protein